MIGPWMTRRRRADRDKRKRSGRYRTPSNQAPPVGLDCPYRKMEAANDDETLEGAVRVLHGDQPHHIGQQRFSHSLPWMSAKDRRLPSTDTLFGRRHRSIRQDVPLAVSSPANRRSLPTTLMVMSCPGKFSSCPPPPRSGGPSRPPQ